MQGRGKNRKSCPVPGLHRVQGPHLASEHRPKQAPLLAPHHGLNSLGNQFHAALQVLVHHSAPGQVSPNARGVLHVQDHRHALGNRVHPAHQPAAVPTRWNWSASRSDATATPTLAVLGHQLDQGLPHDRACPAACENRSRQGSLCSSKSQSLVQRPLHHADPMRQIGPPKLELPRLPSRVLRPHRLPAAQVSVQAALVVNGVQVDPIGMTAPSSKHCVAVRRKSNDKRFTSSVKTMIPLRLKPAVLQASNRPWCCQPAWLDLPNPKHNSERHRSQSPRFESVARKPHVSANAAGPWNCGQHGRRSKFAPR